MSVVSAHNRTTGTVREAMPAATVPARDTAAWTDLYTAHAAQVRSLVSYRLGAGSADVDDLTADVFLRAWQASGQYEDRGRPVTAWLYEIARNRLTDHYRWQAHRPTVPLELADRVIGADGLSDADGRLLRRQIVQAMADLTPLQQRVLVRRFLRGQSVAETAAAVGTSEDGVKQAQRRALAQLRRTLTCPCGCWQVALGMAG